MPECVIDGLHIHYIDEGQGPAVLLLHGWAAPAETYRLIINHLAQNHRVVAPNMPGCGGSDEPPVPWEAADYVDFIRKFAQAVSLQEAVLIGHSHGGRVIIKMLGSGESAPLIVKKVVLIDSAGLKPRHSLGYYCKVATYKAGKRLLSLPGIRHLFPDALSHFQSKRGSADYRSATPIMRQTMVKLLHEDLSHLLPHMRTSTLLIWGDEDRDTPLEDGRKMERLIPDAGLVVLEGTGHFSFAQRWEQCRRVLDVFLA